MRKPSEIARDIRKHRGLIERCKRITLQRDHARIVHPLEQLWVYVKYSKPREEFLKWELDRLRRLRDRIRAEVHYNEEAAPVVLVNGQIENIKYILKYINK